MENTTKESTRAPSKQLREALLIYGLSLVLITLVVGPGSAIPVIGSNTYLIVSLIFIGLPWWLLKRNNINWRHYGLDLTLVRKDIATAVIALALTFIPFGVGYYTWETNIHDRQFEFSKDHYKQWSVELAGRPTIAPSSESGLWIWSNQTRLHLKLRGHSHDRTQLKLIADVPIQIQYTGSSTVHATDNNRQWVINQIGDSWGEFWLHGNDIPHSIQIAVVSHSTLPIYTGAHAAPLSDQDPLTFHRTYGWIVLWALTHLFFVALPEEYFYRGYLQTRLADYFKFRTKATGATIRAPGYFHLSKANMIGSVLFAFGHFLIPVGGVFSAARLTVFFPSLIFGWLRDHTGSIVAPIIYHAGCNMMVLLVAPHFFR